MPREIINQEEFIEITGRASECRVIKLEEQNIAKIKARCGKYLYTIKIPLSQLDDFLKKIKCQNIKHIE